MYAIRSYYAQEQSQLEPMGEQRVIGIGTNAVLELAAQPGSESQGIAALAVRGRLARGKPVALRRGLGIEA